jgi:hypothetical protein
MEPQIQNKCTAYSLPGSDQLGSELLTNGDMTAWTGDDPDNWTVTEVGDGTSNVTEGASSNECRIISDGTAANLVQVGSLTVGKKYSYSIDIKTATSGNIKLTDGTATVLGSISTTGVKTGTFVSAGTAFGIGRDGACDITFDDVSVKEIGGTHSVTGGFVSGLGDGCTASHNGATFDNPIPSMTLSGDVAGVLSVEADLTAVTAAGFATLNPSGKIYKLDNSGGAAVANIDITGALSAADHMLSVFARGASAADDDIKLRTDNVDGTAQDLTNAYARFSEVITALASDKTRLEIPAGDTVYFFIPQAEVTAVTTSPILCNGAATTRNADSLQLSTIGNFIQSHGTCLVDITYPDASSALASSEGIFSTHSTSVATLLYRGTVVDGKFASADGTNTSVQNDAWSANETSKIFSRWSTQKNLLAAGANGTQDATPANYDGAFTSDNTLSLGNSITYPFYIKNIRIHQEDMGQAWCEAQTT